MLKFQSQVSEFMVKAGQPTPSCPAEVEDRVRMLRVRLIAEELSELSEAFGMEVKFTKRCNGFTLEVGEVRRPMDLVEAADAIGDLEYVSIGTAVALGVDIEPVLEEVHRSNMTKFIDGRRDESGKWVKGPKYEPANLGPIIANQILKVLA